MNRTYLTYSFVTVLFFGLTANQGEAGVYAQAKNDYELVKKLAIAGFGLLACKFAYNKLTKQKTIKPQQGYTPSKAELQGPLKNIRLTNSKQNSPRRSMSYYQISPSKKKSARIKRRESEYSLKDGGKGSYALAISLQSKGIFEEALEHMELAVRDGHQQAKEEYPEMAYQCALHAKKSGNISLSNDYLSRAADAGHEQARNKCAQEAFEAAHRIAQRKDQGNITKIIAAFEMAEKYGHRQAAKKLKKYNAIYADTIYAELPHSMPLGRVHNIIG